MPAGECACVGSMRKEGIEPTQAPLDLDAEIGTIAALGVEEIASPLGILVEGELEDAVHFMLGFGVHRSPSPWPTLPI